MTAQARRAPELVDVELTGKKPSGNIAAAVEDSVYTRSSNSISIANLLSHCSNVLPNQITAKTKLFSNIDFLWNDAAQKPAVMVGFIFPGHKNPRSIKSKNE